MTLLGGYRGSLPPPTKNNSDEQCSGTTEDSTPPLTSVKTSGERQGGKDGWTIVTALPEELQGKSAIDGETIGGGCSEYLGIGIESDIV